MGLPDPRRGCVGLEGAEGAADFGVAAFRNDRGAVVEIAGAVTGLATSGTGEGILTTYRMPFDGFF